MSLENMVGVSYRRLISKAKSGADKKQKIIHEWASGMIFFDAEETQKALLEIHTMNYAELVQRIHTLITKTAEYHDIRRMTPALGVDKHEKLVVYVILSK